MQTQDSRRAGQTLVLYAAAGVALIAFAAMAVDVGYLSASHGRAQNASDAAALAALLELWEQRADGVDEAQARQSAAVEAAALAARSYPELGMQIEFGVWQSGQFTPVDKGTPADAAAVLTYRNEDAPGGPDTTLFARTFGVERVAQYAPAVANYSHRKLIPFGIQEDSVGPAGSALTMYDDSNVVPGNFGLLDMDGGENSNADVTDWTRNGYLGPFYIDPEVGHTIVAGTTGFRSSLSQPIDFHIDAGDVVVALIYRTVWDQGANAQFEVVGYCSLIITGERLNGANKHVDATVVGSYIVGTGQTQGSMRDFMHLCLVK